MVHILAALVLFALLAVGPVLGPAPVRAELIIGLTNANALVTFDSATPGTVSAPISITGIGSETLFDIDIRPADKQLYGLSSAGRIYTINQTTGAATLNASVSGTNLDPAATRFGIDFDPTADQLRVVASTGQNLRVIPATGVTSIDNNLSGAGTGAVSVAYTNNDTNPATNTMLFYIGPSTPNTLFNTSDQNSGVLAALGPLGVSSTQDVGFDISGLSGIGFASLTSPTGSGSSLFRINLSTGAATLVGTIDSGLTVRGIALSPAASVPGPSSLMLLGTGVAGALIYVLRRRSIRR
jgi:uncharacterized protein DUF4394